MEVPFQEGAPDGVGSLGGTGECVAKGLTLKAGLPRERRLSRGEFAPARPPIWGDFIDDIWSFSPAGPPSAGAGGARAAPTIPHNPIIPHDTSECRILHQLTPYGPIWTSVDRVLSNGRLAPWGAGPPEPMVVWL